MLARENHTAYNFMYLSTSRLHRERANLIQTLLTFQAISQKEPSSLLIMPPHALKISIEKRLSQLGLFHKINIKTSGLLHSRWKKWRYWPFFFFYKKKLLTSNVFVRTPRLSLSLINFNIPHVLELHELSKVKEDDRLIITLKKGAYSGLLRKIVVISRSLKKELLHLGFLEKDISIIRSGVNFKTFSSSVPLSKEKLKKPIVVHVGTINKERGADILLYLAQKGIKVIVAGSGAESLKHENIENLGIIPHNAVPSIYNRGNIAVIPYQKELGTVDSFSSLKLMEAMASGRVVIASDLPPIRELIEHKKNGLVIPPSDPQKWFKAVQSIVKQPELGISLCHKAQKKAREFDWFNRAEKIIALY